MSLYKNFDNVYMQILQLILSIFSIITIVCLFFRPKIGVLLYMVYTFLAPHLIIGNTILGSRTEAIILLGAFFITLYRETQKDVFLPLRPFLVFYGLQVLLIPFSFDSSYSFDVWMVETSKLAFFAFLLSAVYQETYAHKTNMYTICLFGIFIVIIAYGLFLTTIAGLNPYQMILQPVFGGQFNEAYAAGNGGLTSNVSIEGGRLFGRISSLFSSPQLYALDLGFVIFLFYSFITNKKVLYLFSVITIIAIFTCGVRTPIAALFVTLLFILLYYRKYEYFFYVLAVLLMLFYVLPFISTDLVEYVDSIINSSNDINTKGSSLEMRFNQFNACLDIVKDNQLLGKGIGWTGWYLSKYDLHPTALCFESLFFSVLCNMGFMGFIYWIILGIMYFHIIRRNIVNKSNRAILYSLFVYYLAFVGITGDYGYIPQFLLFYIIIYSNCIRDETVIIE